MKRDTSWQAVNSWYDQYHKDEGGYFHREVIFPKLIPLLNLDSNSLIIDLGCGEGVLGRKISEEVDYIGYDLSSSLIRKAKEKDKSKNHKYSVADITKPIKCNQKATDVTFILSLQNLCNPQKAFINAKELIKNDGSIWIVINHPCFRIPKESSWQYDQRKRVQSRVIDRYLSPYKSQIQAHPSQGDKSPSTVSFHFSLTDLSKFFKAAGLAIHQVVELCSHKKSYGKIARAENFARKEFPMFMLIQAKPIN